FHAFQILAAILIDAERTQADRPAVGDIADHLFRAQACRIVGAGLVVDDSLALFSGAVNDMDHRDLELPDVCPRKTLATGLLVVLLAHVHSSRSTALFLACRVPRRAASGV